MRSQCELRQSADGCVGTGELADDRFSDMERPQHRPLLRLVRLHAPQDVIERAHGLPEYGPLLSITHSARSDMAASVTSARDGTPVFARFSSTCVAQITGACAASEIHRISS